MFRVRGDCEGCFLRRRCWPLESARGPWSACPAGLRVRFTPESSGFSEAGSPHGADPIRRALSEVLTLLEGLAGHLCRESGKLEEQSVA